MIATLQEFLVQSLASLIIAAKGLVWPALFFLLLGLAVKRRRLAGDIRRALREASLNLQLMAFNLVFVVPLIAMAGQALANFSAAHGLVFVPASAWDRMHPAAVIFAAVFIGDFTAYWRHRLEHTRLLWPAHAVHHSDTQMTWTAIERFHPINRCSTFFIDASVLILMGLPPFAVVANYLVRHYYGSFIHADLPWTYGPLGRIFVSPAMHRWHHSADERAFDKNFATVFSVFDRAFGTHYVPGPHEGRLGVHDPIAPTLTSQLTYALTPRAYRRTPPEINREGSETEASRAVPAE